MRTSAAPTKMRVYIRLLDRTKIGASHIIYIKPKNKPHLDPFTRLSGKA